MSFTFKKRGTPLDPKRVKIAIQATRASAKRNVNGVLKREERPAPSLPRLKCLEDPIDPDLEQFENDMKMT